MNDSMTYEEVYRNYQGKIKAYIHSKISNASETEDLHSRVFLKVYEKFDSFDQSKASLSTWIYAIARNTLIDYFRVRKVYEEIDNDDIIAEDAYQGILDEETLNELADALEKLPQRERDLIILHYYNRLQLKEIASKMCMSYSNCKLVHNKALIHLRQYMTFD